MPPTRLDRLPCMARPMATPAVPMTEASAVPLMPRIDAAMMTISTFKPILMNELIKLRALPSIC